MRAGHASRTAEYMALFRALESARPANERLFTDAYARRFLRPWMRVAVAVAKLTASLDLLCGYVDRRGPGARTSAVARTRFIDDAISVALRGGISQMVILGAGFDARAYRLPGLSEVAVFEVDHPDTLARKRAAIIAQAPAAAAHVRFIATDFNTQTLAQAMSSSDFDARLPALILWEGVTNYLSPGAVDATLRWCARAASGSRVIFTYIHQAVLDAPQQFAGTSEIFAALQEAGEKWTFGLLPEQVPSYLQERGLTLEEDIGAADYRARYYGEAARDMHGYEFYRIAVAHVTAAA